MRERPALVVLLRRLCPSDLTMWSATGERAVVDGGCGLSGAVAVKGVDPSVVVVGSEIASVWARPVAVLTGRRDHHPWP